MARDKKIIYIIEDDVALNHGIELTLGNEAYECRQFFTLGEIQHIEQADLVILDACVIIGLNQRKPYKSRVAGLSPIILDRKIGTLTLPDDYLCSAA